MTEPTFEKYLKAERIAFCQDIGNQKWDTKMRTTAENMLIAYDQVCDKYLLHKDEVLKLHNDYNSQLKVFRVRAEAALESNKELREKNLKMFSDGVQDEITILGLRDEIVELKSKLEVAEKALKDIEAGTYQIGDTITILLNQIANKALSQIKQTK